jgi:hypothetical protein
MTTSRSDAANKAWRTRRAKAQAALDEQDARKLALSNRAKKAWVTRRAKAGATAPQETAKQGETVRQAAARKAWETRREKKAA